MLEKWWKATIRSLASPNWCLQTKPENWALFKLESVNILYLCASKDELIIKFNMYVLLPVDQLIKKKIMDVVDCWHDLEEISLISVIYNSVLKILDM